MPIELGTLNQAHDRSRTLARKFTDYISVLVVSPVLLVAATSAGAAIRSTAVVRSALSWWLVARLVEEGFDRHDELLAMPMRNLTHDKIKELEKDVDDLKAELAGLKGDTAVEMFKRELKELKV